MTEPNGTPPGTDGNPTLGSGGTTRIDANKPDIGPQGTTRVSPSAAVHGPHGTTRVDTSKATVGPGGTTRVIAGQPQTAITPGAPSSAMHYAPGQTVELNGVTYRIDGELTSTSSEAVTYRVARGTTTLVLKQYHRAIAMPRDVLSQIKSHPHRNLVKIEDFGTLDAQDVELLEWLPAGNLDQYLRRRGPIRDIPTLQKVARGILDGLHHLHSAAGVIYQDLKPENILLGDERLDRVVLADFGISSLVKPGQSEATVKANGTKEYAAPELARFGNQTDVSVDAKVDYFAFGVTLLECWLGRRPFEGVPDAARLRQIRDMDLALPADIDSQLKQLVTGLLRPLPKERWGREEITRWIEGKTLGASDSAQRRQYSKSWFNSQESFATPQELATLLERHPTKGLDYLYLGRIKEWLDAAGDLELSTEVLKITRNFDQDDRLRRAGLLRAIYALDPSRPFVTAGGRTCRTGEEVGNAFWEEKAHYIQALKDPTDPFHLYLQATGEANTSAEILTLHLAADSPELAFNTTVYTLQGGGRDRLKLGDGFYFSAEDINANPQAQSALRAELSTPNSRGLIWLRKLGVIRDLAALENADGIDAMSILKQFPWLTVQTDAPGLTPRAAQLANDLVDANRLDLLDVYLAKGLPLDYANLASPPLHHAARTGNQTATRYLLDHGASVALKDRTGSTPLLVAVEFRQMAVAKLLIERGSDVNTEDNGHMTPLGAACSHLSLQASTYPISPSLVDLLLQHGARPDQPFANGFLPLHGALFDCDSPASAQAILESIVKAGGSVTREGVNCLFKDQDDYDALFCCLLAYKHVHQQAAAFLPLITRIVQLGAKVNGLHEGQTPLHYAALWGDQPLCKALLAAGASPTVASSGDLLPAAIAQAHNSPTLTSLLRPSAGFVGRLKLLLALEHLVKAVALGVLAVCIAPVVPIFNAPQTSGVIDLLTVYLIMQVAVAGGALVVLGSANAFAEWLGSLFESPRRALLSLIALPAAPLVISLITSRLLGAPPRTYVIGDSYTQACVALLVGLALGGAIVLGSLRVSKRSAENRILLRSIGVRVTTSSARSGLPSTRLRWFAISTIVVTIALVARLVLHGPALPTSAVNTPQVDSRTASGTPSRAVSRTASRAASRTRAPAPGWYTVESCNFDRSLPPAEYYRLSRECEARNSQSYRKARDAAADADSCGVTQFLTAGTGVIKPDAQVKNSERRTFISFMGPSGAIRNHFPVHGPIALCRINFMNGSFIVADRAFNEAMRRVGERHAFVYNVVQRETEPYTGRMEQSTAPGAAGARAAEKTPTDRSTTAVTDYSADFSDSSNPSR